MSKRTFDGILCFGGEDWWYHNRGHFDMQVMRAAAQRVPVVYVNSIGVRNHSPREGRVFLGRVKRKLASVARGSVRVEPGFNVLSTWTGPGALGRRLTRPLAVNQIRGVLDSLSIRRPLGWVTCPTALPLLGRFNEVGQVFQRTDRFEAFVEGPASAELGACCESLRRQADLTLYCSQGLLQSERHPERPSLFVDHGLDFERFASAGDRRQEPLEMRDLRRPRVGFIGGLDSHTFDSDLFLATARRLPAVDFAMVGGSTLPAEWCTLPNVHFLGRKPLEAVADYMGACDVLIMPWRQNDWIRACNPIKLREYLAVGRPIVSTPFEALRPYSGLVDIADTPESFASAIARALVQEHDPAPGRNLVRQGSWQDRWDLIVRGLGAAGLSPVQRDRNEVAA